RRNLSRLRRRRLPASGTVAARPGCPRPRPPALLRGHHLAVQDRYAAATWIGVRTGRRRWARASHGITGLAGARGAAPLVSARRKRGGRRFAAGTAINRRHLPGPPRPPRPRLARRSIVDLRRRSRT